MHIRHAAIYLNALGLSGSLQSIHLACPMFVTKSSVAVRCTLRNCLISVEMKSSFTGNLVPSDPSPPLFDARLSSAWDKVGEVVASDDVGLRVPGSLSWTGS